MGCVPIFKCKHRLKVIHLNVYNIVNIKYKGGKMKYRNVREILMNLIPIGAFLLSLLIGTIMIAFLGVNPLVAYQALLIGGSTGSGFTTSHFYRIPYSI